MSNQENDRKQQQHQHHHYYNQENDLKKQQHIQELHDDQQLIQQQQQQQQQQEHQQAKLQEQQHNNQTIKNPPLTMNSSSPPSNLPPTPPSQHQHLDSPPPDSTHSSYGYVFSSPQVLDQSTIYQSPPTDQTTSYSYVFSPSSPDIKPAKPPSPSPAAASFPVSETGSKTQDQENNIRKISVFGRKKDISKKRALLGCRVLGFICCLVSFSVMAADKNQGWAIDSFYRYKEFRYCLSVTVIGFAYSGLQGYELAYSLATGRITRKNLRYLLDFSLDQVLTYLLLSASSSAAFRVEDWELNWGKDKFPSMAKSSVVLSFLAFVAFALCSLLSGQILFTPSSA